MFLLHIEHTVNDFAAWKQNFDGDPVGRARAGVRRYRISRPVDDPNHVMIDLELDNKGQAESLLASLQELWRGPVGKVLTNPQTRLYEVVESKEMQGLRL